MKAPFSISEVKKKWIDNEASPAGSAVMKINISRHQTLPQHRIVSIKHFHSLILKTILFVRSPRPLSGDLNV